MSIIKTITKARGSAGHASSDGERKYGFALQVVTDDPADGPQTIGAALGFAPFDSYGFGNDNDPLAHARIISITRPGDSPYIWDVEVDYDTSVEDWDEDPLARPTVIDYDFQPYERVATYTTDATPQPIVNAARIFFDPGPMIDDSRLTIIMQRNELVFPLATAIQYQNAVNSDSWFGLAPGQGKVLINGQYTKESGYSFYAMRYEIHVRWETWTLYVLNQGMTQRSGKPCTQEDGTTPVSEPVPLDGSGSQLPWPIDLTAVKYLPFNVLNQLPFSALSLP